MQAVSRGYLLCKFNRNEVAFDGRDNRDTGVFPLYPEYDWGTIAAWAWAHGLVADALDRLGLVDMKKIVATGHSRGEKLPCAPVYMMSVLPSLHPIHQVLEEQVAFAISKRGKSPNV